MDSRKVVPMNLFARQQWRNRHRGQTYRHRERGGEREMYGKSNMETYITKCKIDRICCMSHGTQTGALYQPRGMGWGGRWEGGSRGRGHMYIYG